MSNFGPVEWALVALALPLVASMLAALLGAFGANRLAHVPVIVAFASATVAAGMSLAQLARQSGDSIQSASAAYPWFHAGQVAVDYSITVDPLASIMLLTVTFVATFIAIFSSSYMHDDDGYARYFSVMALFVFAMLVLVTADNFLILVAGWEGVGLCSYLLVGYYYAKPSAAAAARKAFLVTRLGDVGMILGIFWLWSLGDYHTNFAKLFEVLQANAESHTQLGYALLLLFCGAIGKSAQIPLYVWLPDAMEGPTPVSALIHAATMVTAGVYLLARCAPLFVLVPEVQLTVSLIGAATAFLAGFMALAQNDLKRVLAYSTVSQLGFMFMALGTGGPIAPSLAVTAAIFHLFTHAFFKALLFLGSGSVMHAMGNVIDLRKFGGLRKVMPVTHATFLVGSAALAGVPLLSGFWSKDQILECLYLASASGSPYAGGYLIVLILAMLTAGLTAFYTFRAYFLTFWGPERIPEEAHGHAHESPQAMTIPLIVLALGALLLGLVLEPITHAFPHWIGQSPSLVLANLGANPVYGAHYEAHEYPHINWALAGISSVVAILGVLLAYQMVGQGGPEVVPGGLKPLYTLSRDQLYVNDLYTLFLVKPLEGLAIAGRQLDFVLALVVRLFASVPTLLAGMLRSAQNGLVQFYSLGMILGLAIVLGVVLVRTYG